MSLYTCRSWQSRLHITGTTFGQQQRADGAQAQSGSALVQRDIIAPPAAQEYTYRGRVVGAFFDEHGLPTAALRAVLEGDARHAVAKKEREGRRLDYPDCNKRWSQTSGARPTAPPCGFARSPVPCTWSRASGRSCKLASCAQCAFAAVAVSRRLGSADLW
jgi:hypothetical protein